MAEKYFVASNSSEGFCSYYGDALDFVKFNRIYAIKGGSGTGKATFMKAIAREAEKRGFSVRYIYCSSDAQSLDGIIIKDLKIAVLDGTAPHVYEPRMVGAVDEIVDLGAFLNSSILQKLRNTIESVMDEKKRGFERAYRHLSAYKSLSRSIEDIIYPCIKFDKMRHFALRFANSLQLGKGSEEHLLVRSIGMRGLSSFDTYYENAEIYYEINDYYDSAHILLREIYNILREKKVNMRLSNNPIINSRYDAICAYESGLTFEIGNRMDVDARSINMKRFVDCDRINEIRQKYRAIARARDEVLQLALAEFEDIKKYHFILEEIYGSAMDFEAKERFTVEFCKKIFENN